MTSILVVEDDEQLRTAVSRDLTHRGFDVTSVVSVAEARTELEGKGYDVLLTDLRLGERDGIDLLGELPNLAPTTRTILMSAYATARDHQRAIELGAVQVLCKPFTALELTHAIRQAIECETGFRGSLHGLSLVDVLQMFHFARRSVCVAVGGQKRGEIHVRDGEIVHAEHGPDKGEDALRGILAMNSGSIRTAPLEGGPKSIERTFQGLLLDMLRAIDEEGRETFVDFDEVIAPVAGAVRHASVLPPAPDASALCANIVARVEGALRCGAVDLRDKSLLGAHIQHGESGDPAALVNDAIGLLRGSSLTRLEEIVGLGIGISDVPIGAFQEARAVSTDSWRLALSTHGGGKALVLVTKRETNPGLAFWHLRASIPAFEREL
jgi:DNA-binding response OmpR family regulator